MHPITPSVPLLVFTNLLFIFPAFRAYHRSAWPLFISFIFTGMISMLFHACYALCETGNTDLWRPDAVASYTIFLLITLYAFNIRGLAPWVAWLVFALSVLLFSAIFASNLDDPDAAATYVCGSAVLLLIGSVVADETTWVVMGCRSRRYTSLPVCNPSSADALAMRRRERALLCAVGAALVSFVMLTLSNKAPTSETGNLLHSLWHIGMVSTGYIAMDLHPVVVW